MIFFPEAVSKIDASRTALSANHIFASGESANQSLGSKRQFENKTESKFCSKVFYTDVKWEWAAIKMKNISLGCIF